MEIRVGIPASFRRFSAAAVELRAAILVSANALRGRNRFWRPAADLFCGADVALDSAGFVAMFRYGGYPWSVEDYVELAAAHPWAWWASMDYCCEPEIAHDASEVARRQELTLDKLSELRELAGLVGLKAPMPVIQGWTPDQYARCAGQIPEMPDLVGVGSVCRRSVNGPAGLLAVVDRLDRELPPQTRLHLFGVKGDAIGHLAGHPRMESVDSMAWDFGCRRRRGAEPYTLDTRIRWMRRWYEEQCGTLMRAVLA